MTNGSLMKVESLQNAPLILQYFWPALSDNWSWKTILGLFESGCFTQGLLYICMHIYYSPLKAAVIMKAKLIFVHVLH